MFSVAWTASPTQVQVSDWRRIGNAPEDAGWHEFRVNPGVGLGCILWLLYHCYVPFYIPFLCLGV